MLPVLIVGPESYACDHSTIRTRRSRDCSEYIAFADKFSQSTSFDSALARKDRSGQPRPTPAWNRRGAFRRWSSSLRTTTFTAFAPAIDQYVQRGSVLIPIHKGNPALKSLPAFLKIVGLRLSVESEHNAAA